MQLDLACLSTALVQHLLIPGPFGDREDVLYHTGYGKITAVPTTL
jgi:hypothetical protein